MASSQDGCSARSPRALTLVRPEPPRSVWGRAPMQAASRLWSSLLQLDGTLQVELLDPMVAGLTDIDAAAGRDCNPMRQQELGILRRSCRERPTARGLHRWH